MKIPFDIQKKLNLKWVDRLLNSAVGLVLIFIASKIFFYSYETEYALFLIISLIVIPNLVLWHRYRHRLSPESENRHRQAQLNILCSLIMLYLVLVLAILKPESMVLYYIVYFVTLIIYLWSLVTVYHISLEMDQSRAARGTFWLLLVLALIVVAANTAFLIAILGTLYKVQHSDMPPALANTLFYLPVIITYLSPFIFLAGFTVFLYKMRSALSLRMVAKYLIIMFGSFFIFCLGNILFIVGAYNSIF